MDEAIIAEMDEIYSNYLDEIYSNYLDKYNKNSVACVGWLDDLENIKVRFEKIHEGGIGDNDSILDVGCGVAHLYT